MPNTTVSQLQFENTGELLDIKPLVDYIYPVGAIYMSATQINPAALFGGTWEQIQDTFLLCAGSLYAGGTTGGTASNTHTHTLSHTHTMAHTHTQVATTSGGPSNNTSGSTAITVAQMPSHNHGSAGNHSHQQRQETGNNGQANTIMRDVSGSVAGDVRWTNKQYSWYENRQGVRTADAGAHTHSSNGSGSGHTHTLSSHTHSTSATTTGGASTTTTSDASTATTSAASASDNMPPYLAVYVYKRTA